jgi:hypothetical protein
MIKATGAAHVLDPGEFDRDPERVGDHRRYPAMRS